MRGITVEYNSRKGGDTYVVTKSRGKLTIDEVQEALIEKGLGVIVALVAYVAWKRRDM